MSAKIDTFDLYEAVEAVFDRYGGVDAATARHFVGASDRGGFVPVNWENGGRGLAALPLEMKLNLYKAVAQEEHWQNLDLFIAINNCLGLPEGFYEDQAHHAKTFVSNVGELDEFKKFMENTLVGNRKKDFVEFLIVAYAAHCNIPSVDVEFFADYGRKTLGGIWSYLEQTVRINTACPIWFVPEELLDTVIHEVEHAKQDYLVWKWHDDHSSWNQSSAGITHPEHLAGKIFSCSNAFIGGYYIGCDKSFQGYKQQPVEVSARYSAAAAVEAAHTFVHRMCRKPEPTFSPFAALPIERSAAAPSPVSIAMEFTTESCDITGHQVRRLSTTTDVYQEFPANDLR